MGDCIFAWSRLATSQFCFCQQGPGPPAYPRPPSCSSPPPSPPAGTTLCPARNPVRRGGTATSWPPRDQMEKARLLWRKICYFFCKITTWMNAMERKPLVCLFNYCQFCWQSFQSVNTLKLLSWATPGELPGSSRQPVMSTEPSRKASSHIALPNLQQTLSSMGNCPLNYVLNHLPSWKLSPTGVPAELSHYWKKF